MIYSSVEKCCLNCHFFTLKPSVAGFPLSVDERKRKALLAQATTIAATKTTKHTLADYRCHKGASKNDKYDLSSLIQDRGDSCFFYPYMRGLEGKLITVEELERRETDRHEGKQNRAWIKWIALIAMATLIVAILALLPNLAGDIWRSLEYLVRYFFCK